MANDVEQHHVCVVLSAENYSATAYLCAQPTRRKLQRVIGEVSLRGLPSAPGYELLADELEQILWQAASAAAAVLEQHLPKLQAIVAKNAENEAKRRRTLSS